jgi:hypothetical protein
MDFINSPELAGLTIDHASGLIHGTPSGGHAGSVTISLQDAAAPASTPATATVTLNILGITTTSIPGGQAGQPYPLPGTPQVKLNVIGNDGQSISWAITDRVGEISGLSIDTNGVVTGNPPKSHIFHPTFKADAGSVPQTQTTIQFVVTGSFGRFHTGLDGAGNLLADGAIDPLYRLIASADAAFPGPNALVATSAPPAAVPMGWLPGAASKWIAPRQDALNNNAVGDYKYQIAFDLTHFDAATASISGNVSSDNDSFYTLNGGAEHAVTQAPASFSIPVGSGFAAGMNTLVIRVNNGGLSPNPTGLRAELDGQAASTA